MKKRGIKLLKCVLIVFILLNISYISCYSQALKLKNATRQLIESATPGQQFRESYFILFTLKGDPKALQLDSVCLAANCFNLLQPDTNLIKSNIIIGKKNKILELNVVMSDLTGMKNETTSVSGYNDILYYHSGSRAKKVVIDSYHLLPNKME